LAQAQEVATGVVQYLLYVVPAEEKSGTYFFFP
jgi:hypothetical protein